MPLVRHLFAEAVKIYLQNASLVVYICIFVNMLKQLISMVTATLLSFSLLTIAVIPHHHHGEMPCFSMNDQHEHHSDACSQEACHHHDHSASDEPETCVLDQLVIAAANSSNEHSQLIAPANHLDIAILCALCQYNFASVEKNPNLQGISYLIHYHSIFASHSLGLRAPPAIA